MTDCIFFLEPGTCCTLQSFMANPATKGFSLPSGLGKFCNLSKVFQNVNWAFNSSSPDLLLFLSNVGAMHRKSQEI